jgi:hypothetical protein
MVSFHELGAHLDVVRARPRFGAAGPSKEAIVVFFGDLKGGVQVQIGC